MRNVLPVQELAPDKQKSKGNSPVTQQILAEIAAKNAILLNAIQCCINETSEGGAQPASYYNN
jgi:hypothetical protein